MSTTKTLTGRTRYRNHKTAFRTPVVVLQVEWRVTGVYEDMHGSGPEFDFTEWRDARIEDVTTKDTA